MRNIMLIPFLWATLTQGAYAFPITPDPVITPGDHCTVDSPDFEEYRYGERIPYCYRNVSTRVKNEIYEMYDIPEKCRHRYTIDHFIPLALGGSNEINNLWPEHKLVKAQRPNLEYSLYIAMKDDKITQEKAVNIIIEAKRNLQLLYQKPFNTKGPTGKKPSCDIPGQWLEDR